LIAIVLAGVFATLLAPYDPRAQPDIIALRSQAPSFAHPFGTDAFSRDVLSRVLHGTRVSLAVSFLAVTLAVFVGTTLGAIAGYAGGITDTILMRVNDALLSIPRVLLLIGVVALWGGSIPLTGLVLMLGLTGWFGMSRLVRGEVKSIATREFIVAA